MTFTIRNPALLAAAPHAKNSPSYFIPTFDLNKRKDATKIAFGAANRKILVSLDDEASVFVFLNASRWPMVVPQTSSPCGMLLGASALMNTILQEVNERRLFLGGSKNGISMTILGDKPLNGAVGWYAWKKTLR